jgi:esterase/lipase
MNYTTVVEARSLLAWLRREGFDRIGVTGYSQGGVMSAFAAALTAFPIAAIPRGAADAARPIFVEGGLSKSMNWSKLNEQLGDEARSYFARCLEPVTVSRFPPPADPTLAIIVNARHDGFVPAEQAIALHRHWAGSELRWLEGGHVTAALFIQAQRQAILDAFGLLVQRQP